LTAELTASPARLSCECRMGRRRCGPLAQRLEQWTHNPLVPGSNPGGPTKNLSRRGVTRITRTKPEGIKDSLDQSHSISSIQRKLCGGDGLLPILFRR